jgi:hypothetical protein
MKTPFCDAAVAKSTVLWQYHQERLGSSDTDAARAKREVKTKQYYRTSSKGGEGGHTGVGTVGVVGGFHQYRD